MHPANVFPHDVQYGRAYQTILDRTREQERAGILHQRPDNVGPTTLVYVMRPGVETVPSLRRRNDRRRRLCRRRRCRRPRFENCAKFYFRKCVYFYLLNTFKYFIVLSAY